MDNVAQYIKENKDLILNKQYQQFFEYCPTGITTEVVNTFLTAKINFLPYMKTITTALFANDVKLPETFVIPNNIKNIGALAFYNNKNVKHIVIPESVKSIEFNAFADCENLETLELKEGIEILGSNIIQNTWKLKSLTIPASVTEIDDECFYGAQMVTINFKGKYQSTMKRSTFEECDKLVSIILPEGLNAISVDSFASCSNLETIHFPSTLKFIATTAFIGCDDIKTIYYDGTKQDWENKVSCHSPEINNVNITFLK